MHQYNIKDFRSTSSQVKGVLSIFALICSVLFILPMLLVAVVFIDDPEFGVVFTLTVILLTFFITALPIIFSLKALKRIRNYKKYMHYIIESRNSSIEHIASLAYVDPAVARNELEDLVNKNYFKSARIDYASNSILIEGLQLFRNNPTPAPNMQMQSPGAEMLLCNDCGAYFEGVRENTTYCIYCSSKNISQAPHSNEGML